MCIVYTSRIGYRGADALDTTVKSGAGLGRILAPTWELVLGVKAGHDDRRWRDQPIPTLTEAEYTERYYTLLRDRFRAKPDTFVELLRRERIILCCYCKPDVFCHRYLAVDILEKIALAKGLPFARGGELPIR
ncbi:MAG: DUF488 family protein, N3 subclade [Aggregatilineales bacterium]